MFKRKLLICFFILTLTASIVGFFSWRNRVDASLSLGFGGKIIYTQYCCNGIMLTIGPPRGGTFLFSWGDSFPYAYYQFYRSGPWTKGTYSPGGACYTGTYCAVTLPTTGIIKKIGTSL